MGKRTAKKSGVGSLGKSLMKNGKKKAAGYQVSYQELDRHTIDKDDKEEYHRKLQSVTHQNDLEELLNMAMLSDREFVAEKEAVVILQSTAGRLHYDDETANVDSDLSRRGERNQIIIPRRPKWDRSMTRKHLEDLEKEAFLTWRRGLASTVELDAGITLSPYEKNLEVWRQLWRVVEKSNIVVQIVDSRDPLFYISTDLRRYVTEGFEGKYFMLLINKSDFLSEDLRQLWAQYFSRKGIDALFFSALAEAEAIEAEIELQRQLAIQSDLNRGREVESDDDDSADDSSDSLGLQGNQKQIPFIMPNSGEVIGSERLLDVFVNIGRDRLGIPSGQRVIVGFTGYPNVGKSSTINVLCKRKLVSVSQTPGKTKHFQTVNLGSDLTLCDCPGLVFPRLCSGKAEMVVNGVLPIDSMRDHRGPVSLVCRRFSRESLERIYAIQIAKPLVLEDPNRPARCEELLHPYATKRGYMTSSKGCAVPDESRGARIILKDYLGGKLLYCHRPPTEEEEAADVPRPVSSTTAGVATPWVSSLGGTMA